MKSTKNQNSPKLVLPPEGGGRTGGTTGTQRTRDDPEEDAASRQAKKRSATQRRAKSPPNPPGGGEKPSRQAPATAHANIRDNSPFQAPEFRGRRKKGGWETHSPFNPPPCACQPFPNPRVTQLPHHGNFHSVRR